MFGFLKKIFGTAQSRLVKRYQKLVPEVNRWEETYQALSNDQIVQKTAEFKKRVAEGETL